jgi:[acyl-carrier-protein] S-malonyltransferase
MTRALVFPGQGSQAVGMGRALAENFATARAVFEEIEDALGQKLTTLMFEGPESNLNLTENTQPAIMAASLAAARVLQVDAKLDFSRVATFVAGHSLGEYSALAAAGALGLADTARLLKTRGKAMQAAVPVGQGAMAAVLGLDFEAVAEVAKAACKRPDGGPDDVCAAANDNAPGQIVVSGHAEAVERAGVLAKEKGAKRVVPLAVSAPFHCGLMQPAAAAMEAALAAVTIAAPVPALVANVTAAPVATPADIRALLVAQVTGTVRWRETMSFLKAEGVETLIEIGNGKVLAGLARSNDKSFTTLPCGTPEEIDALVKALA